MQLGVAGEETRGDLLFTVESGLLVGILTVAHILNLDPLAVQHIRELGGRLVFGIEAREVVGDHAVVAGGMSEHLLREGETGLGGHGTFSLDLLDDLRVVSRINDNCDGAVILGRGADHRGAADVDVFDGVSERAVRLRDRLLKRVEVPDDGVDRINAVLFQSLHVLGDVAAGQNAGVNLRVKRLHAAVEHFREASVVCDFFHSHAFLLEELGGAAGRKKVVAEGDELTGEIHNAGFI